MIDPAEDLLGVNEAARRCGLTVRTLQYYDRTGLVPARRTEGDRRRYGPAELTRLQQVQFLHQAGFALADIPGVLASRDPADLFTEQLDRLRRDALVLRARTTIVEAVVRVLTAQPDAVLPVRLLTALMDHEATLFRYPEIDFAGRPTSRLGELRNENEMLAVYVTWKALCIEALLLLTNGWAPESDLGLDLGRRFAALAEATVGDDPAVAAELASIDAQDRLWPPADRELKINTEGFVDACLHAYAAHAAASGS